jgi:starch phosphorylase
MIVQRFLPRALPPTLAPLMELALDLRWNWNHAAIDLWRQIDPPLWEASGNPVLILETVSHARLQTLADDSGFTAQVHELGDLRHSYLERPTWMAQAHAGDRLDGVAYFSMEFGLSESLPIYSGGLGILAGDHLKAASDLGVPVIGVGLLYQQGYFRQGLDAEGEQIAYYPFNDPLWLPVLPVRDAAGEWLRVRLDLPGRQLTLRTWQAQVGRVTLYLLDSNDPLNAPRDRGITAELYGGGAEQRIQQELALGIGGWRLLQTLGLKCEVCHLNEGHAAFAVLERARSCMAHTGVDFAAALRCTRAGNLFTTHTPVAAGFDRFEPRMLTQYLGDYAQSLGLDDKALLALGRRNPDDAGEPFNMAYLALRGSAATNAVSRLHAEVSRAIFAPLFPRLPLAEIPVGHVTNGVHVPSWDAGPADSLWTRACGEHRWLGDLANLEDDFRRLPDTELWALRNAARGRLVDEVRARLATQLAARGVDSTTRDSLAEVLDPATLTLCFARRFAAYKRPNLLLTDPDRLERLLSDPQRPVQLVIAGKAHPRDEVGRSLLRAWAEFLRRPAVRPRVVFLEDYDMSVAAALVQGADLWVNTPRRPWEASGTSGMKVLVNGGLNLSELDGWWAEAYAPELGWSLGDGREHDDDPAWDRAEAEQLYGLLEREVVPAFYQRDERGIPAAWVSRMRESMAQLTGHFSTNRMGREYTESYYLAAASAYRARVAQHARLGIELETWAQETARHWPAVATEAVERTIEGGRHLVTARISCKGLDPHGLRVELYADASSPGSAPERIAMTAVDNPGGNSASCLYRAEVATQRALDDYTVRILPDHSAARLPLELNLVTWER